MDVLLDTCGRRRVMFPLLLYLFVVKAAADCPKPQATEKIVLTNEALLLNDFPDGVDITLECAHGYVVESGSGSITCVDNNWTVPDLSCKKIDCGPPNPQPNMSFNTSAGTLFGAVIKAVCDKGFRIIGTSYSQCYATGWNRKSKCKIVTCNKPSEVTNGRSSWVSQDDPEYGDTIKYVCDAGYTLVGNDSIVCGETRDYDSRPPACQGGRDILTTAGIATTTGGTSTTSSSLPGEHDGAVDTNKDIGYMPVIVSVIGVSIAVCIVALFLHKFLLRRKGSYDTREDLKPELLQFQNL